MLPKAYIPSFYLNRESVPSFEQNPFSLPAVKKLQEMELHPAVTFFIGENGSGKSTLLEALAVKCGFNAEGGSKNFNFATRDSVSELHEHLRVARNHPRPYDGFFLRAESFFNVATEIERLAVGSSYGPRSLHEQSHGEAFLALLLNRFRGDGLYFLDEPEAALSPQRQLAVLRRIHDLVENNSQFVIATHSPILMAYPQARIYLFSENGIEEVHYEETEHYQVTRNFLGNYKRMLHLLFKDEEGEGGEKV